MTHLACYRPVKDGELRAYPVQMADFYSLMLLQLCAPQCRCMEVRSARLSGAQRERLVSLVREL